MSNIIMCSECKMCDGDRCTFFDNYSDRESSIACILFEPKKQTVFDRITESPEVLAEKLVLEMPMSGWYRSIILDRVYRTKSEAIAATVEKLKEHSK